VFNGYEARWAMAHQLFVRFGEDRFRFGGGDADFEIRSARRFRKYSKNV
jgi:hypothetical protein